MFQASPSSSYSLYLPVAKAYDSADGGAWVFEAPLSEPGQDLQKERMNMRGLRKGLEVFRRLDMPVDWDHLWERTREPKWLIGKGLSLFDAPHPKTGEEVPWVKGVIFKDKEIARQAKEHWDACQKSGSGGLGISVAGQVVERDPLDKSHILEPMVTSIALTPVPVVDANSSTVNFLKALDRAESQLRDGLVKSVASVPFPIVPELSGRLQPVFAEHLLAPSLERHLAELRKAMEVTGDLARSGPGANALELEDTGKPGSGKSRLRSAERRYSGPASDEEDADEEELSQRPLLSKSQQAELAALLRSTQRYLTPLFGR